MFGQGLLTFPWIKASTIQHADPLNDDEEVVIFDLFWEPKFGVPIRESLRGMGISACKYGPYNMA